ncbi:hypothetical protein FS749_002543 [Ceratobasidium sp. UAMH 11750]|nr:hypothetical protein FS749_002543 [Ceratobasidium sp. UAMH 11750]
MSTTPPRSSAQPIPAATHGRARSASVYSISSLPALSNSPSVSPHSPTLPTLPQLSPSLTGKSLTAIFTGPQSPLKSAPGSFFANSGVGGGIQGPGIVAEEDDDHDHAVFHGEFPSSPPRGHTRHGSISWGTAPRIAGSEFDNRVEERGNGLLRRFSLGSAFGSRPTPAIMTSSPPQNVASPAPKLPAAPTAPREPPVVRKPSPLRGNSNSLGLGGLAPPAQDPVKHRGISPMGERMLKGHFDGFGM